MLTLTETARMRAASSFLVVAPPMPMEGVGLQIEEMTISIS